MSSPVILDEIFFRSPDRACDISDILRRMDSFDGGGPKFVIGGSRSYNLDTS